MDSHFNPATYEHVHDWAFAWRKTDSHIRKINKLQEAFTRLKENKPWANTTTRSKLLDTYTEFQPEHLWLCGSWTALQFGNTPDKCVAPHNVADQYRDVDGDVIPRWIRSALRIGVHPNVIVNRIDGADKPVSAIADEHGVDIQMELATAQRVLGRTWTWLRDGYHPHDQLHASEHSTEELAVAWNLPQSVIVNAIEWFEESSRSPPRDATVLDLSSIRSRPSWLHPPQTGLRRQQYE